MKAIIHSSIKGPLMTGLIYQEAVAARAGTDKRNEWPRQFFSTLPHPPRPTGNERFPRWGFSTPLSKIIGMERLSILGGFNTSPPPKSTDRKRFPKSVSFFQHLPHPPIPTGNERFQRWEFSTPLSKFTVQERLSNIGSFNTSPPPKSTDRERFPKLVSFF